MSFNTIAGGFNGAFLWYGPFSQGQRHFFLHIYQNYLVALIDTTANTIFLRRGRAFSRKRRKPVDKQASGPHTNILGQEIKSPI